MSNNFQTMTEAINSLTKKGFIHSFEVHQNHLKCVENNETIPVSDVTITEHHRFEGSSSPGDMSVVYAIECKNGLRGTLVDAYGTYADKDFAIFIQQALINE